MKLTSEKVHKIFMKCLFKEGESTENYVPAQSVMLNIGFHPERLKANTEKIIELLNELPDPFMESKGGGQSFLGLLEDKNGNQWTGLHKQMDELVALGIAIDKVVFPLPREMWHVLPAGMPYVTIKI